MADRPDTRPEIEPCFWDFKGKDWGNSAMVISKDKPDLIIFDPPYFDKKAQEYADKSISELSRQEYLKFLEGFFVFMKKLSKKTTRLAFINADWPARHRSRPKEAVSIAQGFRSGEAAGQGFRSGEAGGIFRIGLQLKKTLKTLFCWSIIAKF